MLTTIATRSETRTSNPVHCNRGTNNSVPNSMQGNSQPANQTKTQTGVGVEQASFLSILLRTFAALPS